MTPAELKARIEAARAFEVEAGDIVFQCQAPTRLAMRSAARAQRRGDAYNHDALLADLVPRHVRGWKGATQGHLVAGLEAAEAAVGVAFEPDLLMALFSAKPEVFDAVAGAMIDAYQAREVAQEETLKN